MLSAVEGLTVVEASLAPLVLPISIGILVGLFLIQARGTAQGRRASSGRSCSSISRRWPTLGVVNIVAHPEILGALNPHLGGRVLRLSIRSQAFLALGSVFLAVTGAETLYADMGHFGRKAIGISWLTLVYPCLMLNYLGQGALLLGNPEAVENPFYLMAPEWARLPLVGIATLATIIASQAVISGAFSVTRQAIQLGFLPRLSTLHTSAKAAGQIYIPVVNWTLLALVILLVLGFGESTHLASAYGIAVTGTMLITTCMLGCPAVPGVEVEPAAGGAVIGLFLLVDGAYFASNLTKIRRRRLVPAGGRGGGVHRADHLGDRAADACASGWTRAQCRCRCSSSRPPARCTACAARRCSWPRAPETIPSALLHNIKHNQVLHERVRDPDRARSRSVPHIDAREPHRSRSETARASTASSCATASWRRSTFRGDLAARQAMRAGRST